MISARQITCAGLTLIGVSLANITATAQQAVPAFTRIVLFGDSLSDVGNVNNQTFGISPGSGYWNGRFSNGPVWVENFATDKEWKRAYDEINDFEKLLTDDGAIFVKFYLHISKDEQLLRFKRREADPYKHWKISEEDWRNRRKWDEHNAAAEDMFEKTSTDGAPWNVVAAN